MAAQQVDLLGSGVDGKSEGPGRRASRRRRRALENGRGHKVSIAPWCDIYRTPLCPEFAEAVAEIPNQALDENDDPCPDLPGVPMTEAHAFLYDPLAPPVFFGHYWRSGPPELAESNTVCVDFSAARENESLVAYRHDEGAALDVERFARYPA